jgi:Ca-activated chloride channel family protein
MAFQSADISDPAVAIIPRERPRPAPEAEPLLRIDSSLVLVPVHVTNSIGASVTGLPREAFHIFEDQTEQTISSFYTDDAPVSIGFLFDASGSMRTKMKKSAEAAAAFFRTANREDEFFLIEFNDRARLMVPFTTESDEVYQQITHTRPTGRTTLIDGIHLALAHMKKARHPRKALVILSDGGDNWSRHSAREVRAALLEADVQMYAMGIFDAEVRTVEEKNGPKLLDELTEITGGKHYPVKNIEQLPEISERIGRELRSQYLLGYYSTNPDRDGKYRQLVVKLDGPHTKELRTSFRRGYYAPAD